MAVGTLKRPRILAILTALAFMPGAIAPHASAAGSERPVLRIDFSQDPPNARPKGFVNLVGGKGVDSLWAVVQDETSPASKKAVSQISSRDGRLDHYAILIYPRGLFRNASISTHVKIHNSSEEASAGLVFRYEDPGNYYVLEASSGNGSVSLYRMADGKRETVIRVLTLIPLEQWHELKVFCNEFESEYFLDGKSLFKARLSQFWRGKVGFWTRADTRASFSDLSIVPYEEVDILKRAKERIFGS